TSSMAWKEHTHLFLFSLPLLGSPHLSVSQTHTHTHTHTHTLSLPLAYSLLFSLSLLLLPATDCNAPNTTVPFGIYNIHTQHTHTHTHTHTLTHTLTAFTIFRHHIYNTYN